MRFTLAAIAALTTSATAYLIGTPTSGQPISIASGTTITWTAVDTDPSTFEIWLVNMAHWPNYVSRIVPSVDRDAYSYRVPTVCSVPANTGYQFNFVRINGDPQAPLAQSQQFDVVDNVACV